jgi:hypothetical protein
MSMGTTVPNGWERAKTVGMRIITIVLALALTPLAFGIAWAQEQQEVAGEEQPSLLDAAQLDQLVLQRPKGTEG